MHYIVYCDESDDKGKFYSNFYGGALVRAADRESIEATLKGAKGKLQGELKWTKVSEYNEADYIAFIDAFFDLIKSEKIKMRIMFTQNINQTSHIDFDEENEYFILYYQFIKHAFGLCNAQSQAFQLCLLANFY